MIFAAYLLVLLGFVGVYFRPIMACAFDSDFARTIGMPVRLINSAMMVLVSVCIVLTLKLIGIMLLMSLFAIPQMIAEVFTTRLRPMIALAVVVSLLCSVAGLFISYYTNVPASATIVLTLIAAYAVVRVGKEMRKRQCAK